VSLEHLIQGPPKTMAPSASCVDAAQLMRDARIGAVIVEENGVPQGIVTDRDLAIRLIAEQREPEKVQLRDIMSRHPIFVSKARSLDDAITTMRDLGIRRLPIVDEHGRLEGMLTMEDVLMLMAQQLGRLGGVIRTELSSTSDAKQKIFHDLNELRLKRDELRLKVHLASADAKSAWRETEPTLADLERRVEREGEEIAHVTSKLGTEIKGAFRRLRDRIARTPASEPVG
jgi:CBS domain-containing protein